MPRGFTTSWPPVADQQKMLDAYDVERAILDRLQSPPHISDADADMDRRRHRDMTEVAIDISRLRLNAIADHIEMTWPADTDIVAGVSSSDD